MALKTSTPKWGPVFGHTSYSVPSGTARRKIAEYHKLVRGGFTRHVAKTTVRMGLPASRGSRRTVVNWQRAQAKIPHFGPQAKTMLSSYRKMKSMFGVQQARSFTSVTQGRGGLCAVRAHTRNGRMVKTFQRQCRQGKG